MTTENINDEPEEITCYLCGSDNHPDNISEVNVGPQWGNEDNQMVCTYCQEHDSFRCDDCGHTCHSSEHHEVFSYHGVCDNCYDSYAWCEDHETYYTDYCEACEENGECGGLVQSYSYKPPVQFYAIVDNEIKMTGRERKNTAYTGFELEMEASHCDREDGAQLAHDLFSPWTVLKHDGSLSNGFEMVSQPMSRQYFIENFPWRSLKELADIGMRSASTRTCGLHIHINKGVFRDNPTGLYRFMSMFYRNADNWKKLAGRSESHYAVWSEDEANAMLKYTRNLRDVYKGTAYSSYDLYNYQRYVALNLQNANTIELRFFKGTLNPNTVAARVEAVHAVADYSRATRNKVNIKQVHDWERFREWTESNGYDLFNTYATSKGV